MPEGHAIHRLARVIREGFAGQRLEVSSPQGRFAEGAELLNGRVLEAADAVGKHLFLGFASGRRPTLDPLWLHVHLGLYGAWTFAGDDAFTGPNAGGAPRVRIAEQDSTLPGDPGSTRPGEWNPPEPRGQVRVRLIGDHGVADLTGPNQCEVITTTQRLAVVHKLGPDPLLPDPDGIGEDAFVRAVRAKATPAGALLMDQSVIAGIGNIYRAELLYLARVHPKRPGRGLAARTVRGIWRDAVRLMRDGEQRGRIITTDPADRASEDDTWYVYHRQGRACLRCGGIVQMAELAGRRVYWCPREQRMR